MISQTANEADIRQQTSEQLPPHWSECLHSSYGEAAWNDRHGREAAGDGPGDLCPLTTLSGPSGLCYHPSGR
jgi:hypothetical protein